MTWWARWRWKARTYPPWPRGLLLCFISLGLLIPANPAGAQRLLVTTTARSVGRAPAASHVHSLAFRRGRPLPGAPRLAGRAPAGPLLLAPDGRFACISSGPSWFGGALSRRQSHTFFEGFRVAPFEKILTMPGTAPGWREWAAGVTGPDDLGNRTILLAGVRDDTPLSGRVRFLLLAPSGRLTPTYSWTLPGPPRAVCGLAGGPAAAALCATPDGPVTALVEPGKGVVNTLALQDGAAPANPRGLAVSRDGNHLLVLTSGYALDGQREEPVSRLYRLSADLSGDVAVSTPLPGTGVASGIHPLDDDGTRCWVATRDTAEGFAHATRVDFGAPDDGFITAQYAYGSVTETFSLAPMPGGDVLAVARDEHVDLLREDGTAAAAKTFAAPVAALLWMEGGLLVAEAGRLHYMNPVSGEIDRTIAFQEGWITGLLPVPSDLLPPRDMDGDGLGAMEDLARGSSVRLEDTDGDGIHDGIDPEPVTPSPRLAVPEEIIFHGDAVGREVRVFLPRSDAGPAGDWNLQFDTGAMPWLRIFPRSSQQSGGRSVPIQMAVDPAYHDAGTEVAGTLTLRMTGTRPGVMAAGSPAPITLRVLPGRRAPRRILWLWGTGDTPSLRLPSDPRRLGTLAARLAGAPHAFSHQENVGPFPDALAPFTLVVITTTAAAEVPVSRRDLLDYVRGGGALLVLGRAPGEGTGKTDVSWLDEVGFRISFHIAVSGPTEMIRAEGPGADWADFMLREGCRVRCDTNYLLARFRDAPDTAALAAREYGYGRIAVLASADLLDSALLARPEHRRFADTLFRWLSRAGLTFDDYDGDGLTNATENPNGNATVEPGETNALLADTDGDGVPDGMEDRNLNGRTDPGETDPRNPDTDGDGTQDGADETPVG